jgi:two-component system nitrogen regulation response regulator GlnG
MSRDRTDVRTAEVTLPMNAARHRRLRQRQRVPTLTLLFHPDWNRIGERVRLERFTAGEVATLSRLEPLLRQPGGSVARPLLDPYLSRTPLLLSPLDSGDGILLSRGGCLTAVRVDGEPLLAERPLTAGQVRRGVVIELADRVVLLLHASTEVDLPMPPRFGLVGDSDGLLQVRRTIEQVADLDLPVLLRGETGTGKELVAAALHQAGPRCQRPLLAVNLGAVPPSLAAAELFGSRRGAFTGADRDRDGLFQRAAGGTLFLDEVGEAPAEVQVMLLRVLDNGEVLPVGAVEPQRVDVRVIAATDSDLESAITDGKFKAPLLHRLSGFSIHLPPLRERRDDLGRLLVHFLRLELPRIGEAHRLEPVEDAQAPSWLPASLVARLARYPWPGNVRELANLVRQLVVESRGAAQVQVGLAVERVLSQVDGAPAEGARGFEGGEAKAATPPVVGRRKGVYRSPWEVTDDELLAALAQNRYQVKPTAEQLGLSRPSLYARMDRCPRLRTAAQVPREELLAAVRRHDGDLNAVVEELKVSERGLKMRLRELGLKEG